MNQDYPRLKVFSALAAGLASFGFAPILVRFAPDTPPLVLASYRTVFAVLLLLPFWLIAKTGSRQHKRSQLLTVFAGMCLGLHFMFWIASLYYTSVASASVLVTIHPIILILVERLYYGRSFAGTTWAGVFLAFGGSVLLGISDSRIPQEFADPLFGNMLALSAAAIFVIYILIGQQIRQTREWIDYVFPVYAAAAVTCVAATYLMGNTLQEINWVGIGAGFGLALGPQIMGHGSMNYAVKYVSPTLLSTLILTEPLFATIAALLIFDELPPAASLLSMVIILIGVGLTWRRKAQNKSGS